MLICVTNSTKGAKKKKKKKIKRKRPRKIKKVKLRYFKVFILNLYPFLMITETNEKEGGGDDRLTRIETQLLSLIEWIVRVDLANMNNNWVSDSDRRAVYSRV